MERYRVAYLVSHPIQYQAPLLRRIAADDEIALTVFFCSDVSVGRFDDPEFGQAVEWDVPLLDGYDHEFLPALGDTRRLGIARPFNYGLARRLRAGGFDALWVHGYARLANVWAMVTARRLGIPVLVRDEAWGGSAHRGAARRAVKALFFVLLRRLVDGTLAIGSHNRRYWLDYGFAPDRVFDMPYAVDNLYFRARARAAEGERAALRASLGLAPERPVILYASKMTGRKRADDLLAAWSRLHRDGRARAPYLLFVGDGERRAPLEAQVHNEGLVDVRFLGFRNQSELPPLYDLCDVFVLPSRHEAWGLVVNEAMNSGCAIVASDEVGAAADLVRDGENGFVFPAGDVEALAGALDRVLADPATARAMGRRSLEIIEGWGFEADVAGLKAALAATVGAATRRRAA